jgi:hypothetical protein
VLLDLGADARGLDERDAGDSWVVEGAVDEAADECSDEPRVVLVGDVLLGDGLAEVLRESVVEADQDRLLVGEQLVEAVGPDAGGLAEQLDGRLGVAAGAEQFERSVEQERAALGLALSIVEPQDPALPSARRPGWALGHLGHRTRSKTSGFVRRRLARKYGFVLDCRHGAWPRDVVTELMGGS